MEGVKQLLTHQNPKKIMETRKYNKQTIATHAVLITAAAATLAVSLVTNPVDKPENNSNQTSQTTK